MSAPLDSGAGSRAEAPWRERRAAWVLGLVVFGLVLGRILPIEATPGRWLIAAGMLPAVGATWLRGRNCRAALGLAVIVISAGYYHVRLLEPAAGLIAEVARAAAADGQERLVTVEGVVVGAPERSASQRGVFARFVPFRRVTSRFDLRVFRAIDADGQSHDESTTVRVTDESGSTSVGAGDRLKVRGFLAAVAPPMNPGAPDRRLLAAQEGVAGWLRVERADLIGPELGPPGVTEWARALLSRAAGAARERARAALGVDEAPASVAGVPGEREQASSLLAALLLGERDDDLRDLSQAFTRLGLTHILCVSGLNLTLFALFLQLALRVLGDHPRLEALILAALVGLYLAVIPAQAPIIRAALMIFIFLAAEWGGRRYDRVNTLAWAAVLTLLWRPLDLWSPGFQLSYLGVASLLVLQRPLRRRLFGEPVALDERPGGLLGVLVRLREWTIEAASAALCAWAVCSPLIAYHTGLFSPLGAVATVVVMPLVTLITGAGYFTVLIGAIAPGLANVMAPLLVWLSGVLAMVVRLMDLAPGTVWYAPKLSITWALAVTAMVAWWILSGRAWMRLRLGLTVALAAWLAWSIMLGPRLERSAAIRIDALALKSGGCTLVRSGGGAMLYDCGSSWLGAGQVEIPRALRELNVAHVETIVISHPDLDRYSAVLDVLSPLGVREVVVGEQFVRRATDFPDGPAAFLIAELDRRGVAVRTVRAGDSWKVGGDQGPTVTVLGPQAGELFQSMLDASLVLLVESKTDDGPHAALLIGEARAEGLRSLLAGTAELRADVLYGSLRGSARGMADNVAAASRTQVIIAPDSGDLEAGDARVVDPVASGCTSAVIGRDGKVSVSTIR